MSAPHPDGARWVAVDGAAPGPGGLRGVEAGGRALVLCNVAGALHAVEDRCPHVAVPLREGRLDGALLECPLHGGRVDVRDGSPAAPPIRRPVAVYPVRVREGQVEIGLPEASPQASQEDIPCTTS